MQAVQDLQLQNKCNKLRVVVLTRTAKMYCVDSSHSMCNLTSSNVMSHFSMNRVGMQCPLICSEVKTVAVKRNGHMMDRPHVNMQNHYITLH